MRNRLWKLLSAAFLVTTVLILSAPPAQAQANCEPFSGTFYMWFTDTWHGWGSFTIGRDVRAASLVTLSTGAFENNAAVIQGTEVWTLDFGKGDTVQLRTLFVVENMADPAEHYHATEFGTFLNGTGMFKHAYGNLSVWGPFGPTLDLPGDVQPPLDAAMRAVTPSLGMICGLNGRD